MAEPIKVDFNDNKNGGGTTKEVLIPPDKAGLKIVINILITIVAGALFYYFNEFGVMQRVMGEFTRNKINVETIVVGKCEQQGKSRMVLSVIDENEAKLAIGRLQKLQDVYDTELVPESGQSAYALISTSNGNVGVVGGSDQVEEIIARSEPEKYVKALNAL